MMIYYYTLGVWSILLGCMFLIRKYNRDNNRPNNPNNNRHRNRNNVEDVINLIQIREMRERVINYEIIDELDIENQNDDCCICLSKLSEVDLEILDKIVKLDCNHYYHKFCLLGWIESDNPLHLNCPLCLNDL